MIFTGFWIQFNLVVSCMEEMIIQEQNERIKWSTEHCKNTIGIGNIYPVRDKSKWSRLVSRRMICINFSRNKIKNNLPPLINLNEMVIVQWWRWRFWEWWNNTDYIHFCLIYQTYRLEWTMKIQLHPTWRENYEGRRHHMLNNAPKWYQPYWFRFTFFLLCILSSMVKWTCLFHFLLLTFKWELMKLIPF